MFTFPLGNCKIIRIYRVCINVWLYTHVSGETALNRNLIKRKYSSSPSTFRLPLKHFLKLILVPRSGEVCGTEVVLVCKFKVAKDARAGNLCTAVKSETLVRVQEYLYTQRNVIKCNRPKLGKFTT